jgi:hypothetical protein
MAISQVGDVIRLALQELEVLAAGTNPSADDYNDGVDWLNVMLSNWEADESMAMRPNLVSGSFNTVAGTASYTAGTGGTAFATRPVRIVHAYSSFQGVDQDLPIGGKADYNKIQNKAVLGRPCSLYYVPSSPLGIIYFDRVPDAVYTINCDMESPVGDYADENAPLLVSPEYRAAMIYNLALVLSGPYKANLKPFTVSEAKRTRERIQYQAHNAQAIESVPTSELIV